MTPNPPPQNAIVHALLLRGFYVYRQERHVERHEVVRRVRFRPHGHVPEIIGRRREIVLVEGRELRQKRANVAGEALGCV